MGKGDARRPAAIPDEEFGDRWERVFKKVPAPPREGLEAPNADPACDCGIPGCFFCPAEDPYAETEEYRSDHLPGGAFHDPEADEHALLLGDGYTRIERGEDR